MITSQNSYKRLRNTLHHNPQSASCSSKKIIIPSLRKFLIGSGKCVQLKLRTNPRQNSNFIIQNLYGKTQQSARYQSVQQYYPRNMGDNSLQKMHIKASITVDQLFGVLKKVLFEVQTESNRNQVLKKLLVILKKDQKIRQVQLTINENQSKQIRKVKSQINTYQNVTNQLLGRIKILKQEIYVARKNRGMFSTLFRDIQKQLKVHQDKYQRLLLLSENSISKQNLDMVKTIIGQSPVMPHDLLTKPFEQTFLQPGGFLTEPIQNSKQTRAFVNFYCSHKKNLSLVKPRKQYVGSMRMIHKGPPTEEQLQSLQNFIEKICTVACMNLRKLHQAMGPNGLVMKNDELWKKVGKLNQHIGKYQKKIQGSKTGLKNKTLLNQEQTLIEPNIQDRHKKCINSTVQTPKQIKKSQESQKQIAQLKATQMLDDKIYSQILYLTNTKHNQSIKSSPQRLSVQLSEDQIHQLILSKVDIILNQHPSKTQLTFFHKTSHKSPSNLIQNSPSQNQLSRKVSKEPITTKTQFQKLPYNSPSIKVLFTEGSVSSSKNINSILNDMKVYASYERAFERMEFEAEYYFQKDKKGKKIGSGLLKKK